MALQGLRVKWKLSSPMLDGAYPLHLDSIIAYAVTHEKLRNGASGPIESLADDLPLAKEHRGDDWIWKASALMSDRVHERGMRLWTRKFDAEDWSRRVVSRHTDLRVKFPLKPYEQVIDTARGFNKQHFQHLPVKYVSSVTAYCIGDHDRLVKLLAPESGYMIALGGRRRMGLGTILDGGFEIEPDARAMDLWQLRLLPWEHEGAVPITAATKPPYHLPDNIRPAFVRPEVLG